MDGASFVFGFDTDSYVAVVRSTEGMAALKKVLEEEGQAQG
jgi:hypothetical protein